ncbi:hypothetical protein RHMOL_Rhmol01G0050300 [Rhododendron molle]|uniref:Uncharacterized protein n=1 Tax=Rhododendron molle TaxID=49168 RepID=A0ACC0PYS2_RHOML|nr:hypothetical protein RHMOL_Rhmol01G0050300 [Rhododendron molle]
MVAEWWWLWCWDEGGLGFRRLRDWNKASIIKVLFNAGRSLNAKVASIVGPTGWRWSRAKNLVVRDIIAHPPMNFLPNIQQEDSVSWTLAANKIYSVQSAWSSLRASGPKVVWFQASCSTLGCHTMDDYSGQTSNQG